MATIGDLVANLRVDSRQFTSGLTKATNQLRSFANTAGKAIIAGTTAATAGFTAMSVKLAADAEQTKIAFEVMTGSAENAGALIADLRAMGAATPFEFTDLANSTKTLLNFGRTSQDVLKDLDMLSNVAAGDANKLQSLALVFGQISANGRLTGGDLLQLVNTGFNPLNQIAAKTGETMRELRDRMSRGEVGFQEVRQAFIDATSAGGLFFKMNEKQSKTLLGRWSTLKDEITTAMIQVGESIMTNLDLKGVTANLTSMVAVFKTDWIPAIEKVIKLAPQLMEAFGKIGKGIGNVAASLDKALKKWEIFTLAAAGLLTGQTPEDMAAAFKDMKRVEQERGMRPTAKPQTAGTTKKNIGGMDVTINPRLGPQTLDEMFKKEQDDLFAMKAGKMKNQAGQFMAGLVRQGLAGLESGLMSLGPAVKSGEKAQLGSLEQGSAEAFEVMRANVGGGGKDVQKEHLKVSEKQLKVSEKMLKAMNNPKLNFNQKLEVMGID